MDADFYELNESILIFLGLRGSSGLWVYGSGGMWEFHAPGSLAWDGYHQETYRNMKADSIAREEIEKRGVTLPSLDVLPAHAPVRQWSDNFKHETRFSEVPRGLLRDLKQHAGEPMEAYLVLLEDLYETGLGDGKYLYPEAAHWTCLEAERDIKRRVNEEPDPAKRQWYRYTVKNVVLLVSLAEQKVVLEPNIDRYEHYSIDDVLRLLAVRYGG